MNGSAKLFNTIQTRRINKATCDEDASIDDLTDTSHNDTSQNEGLVYRNYLDKPSTLISPCHSYSKYAERFAQRDLTKENDGLHAFRGILNILKTTPAGNLTCTINKSLIDELNHGSTAFPELLSAWKMGRSLPHKDTSLVPSRLEAPTPAA